MAERCSRSRREERVVGNGKEESAPNEEKGINPEYAVKNWHQSSGRSEKVEMSVQASKVEVRK